ncbi:MAG: Gfo/Idh/MocA family oxidoreductase [Planctomycetota bacterium]
MTDGHDSRPSSARRRFLKQSALMAGAGLVAMGAGKSSDRRAPAAKGRGADPTPPRDGETIRIAVLGVGGMGRGHCRSIVRFARDGAQNVEIVAVCDVNDLHAAQAVKDIADAGQKAPADAYRDYREILERDDVHAVLIASPEHWHARMAIDAVHAGKDVYCEKPMTLHLDEALAVRETVHANPGVIFVVGTQKMMLPKYREAKKLIEAGAIGKPTFSQTSYCRNSPDGEWNYYGLDPAWEPGVNVDWDAWLGEYGPREWDPKVYIRWRRYRDFSTGILGDLLVHEMTPMILALDSVGWPTHVVATGGHYIDKEMENHDQVNLTIQFEREHTMIVAGSTCNEVGLENLIRGHEGNIYLNSRHCELRPTRPFVDHIDPMRVECPDIGNDQNVMRRSWLDAIRSREQPDSTVDFATKVMVAVDLASRSIWNKCAYSFDPETMTARRV